MRKDSWNTCMVTPRMAGREGWLCACLLGPIDGVDVFGIQRRVDGRNFCLNSWLAGSC